MPLISVKMWPGRDEDAKKKLAQSLMETASQVLNTPATAFTVMIEDIAREEWEEKVTQPEIDPKPECVFIRKGEPSKN